MEANSSICIYAHRTIGNVFQILYSEKIPIKINQSFDSDLILAVEGKGSEPQVVFLHHLLEFPAILPFSDGSEAEITISNPMEYPVELYSLEFDKQYLEEEEVNRGHQNTFYYHPKCSI